MAILFALLFPLILGGFSIYGPLLDKSLTRVQQNRAVQFRLSVFSWMLAFMLLAGLVFLPSKQRVLILAPFWLLSIGLSRIWRHTRMRAGQLRAEDGAAPPNVDVECLKRLN